MSTAADGTAVSGDASFDPVLDWVVSGFLVAVGTLLGVGGWLAAGVASHAWAADVVASMTVRSTVLSDEVLVATVESLTRWGGWGLLATGVALIAGGVAFLVYRRRRDHAGPDRPTVAVLGGVVTLAAVIVPFSPLLGGAVAGYLRRDDGLATDALSGLAAAVPLVLLGGALLWGAVAAGAAPIAFVLGVALAISACYTVGLSAAGGALAAAVAADDGVQPQRSA